MARSVYYQKGLRSSLAPLYQARRPEGEIRFRRSPIELLLFGGYNRGEEPGCGQYRSGALRRSRGRALSMATIVAGFGVPHNPGNPEAVLKGAREIGALYEKIADEAQ